jgi:hypothetical protein
MKILLAVDGSECSDAVVEEVAMIFRCRDASRNALGKFAQELMRSSVKFPFDPLVYRLP